MAKAAAIAPRGRTVGPLGRGRDVATLFPWALPFCWVNGWAFGPSIASAPLALPVLRWDLRRVARSGKYSIGEASSQRVPAAVVVQPSAPPAWGFVIHEHSSCQFVFYEL